MSKKASPDHPIQDLIASRWSPYGFSNKPVTQQDLLSLFEAARWAASSYNEQPWSFIVATRENSEEFNRLLSCLVEPNRKWAAAAAALALSVASLKFSRNGKPNAAAQHDVGLAAGNLSLEATARGLSVHQMIGILPDVAREIYNIPEDYLPLTALAIGHAASADELPDTLKERDQAPRSRKPLAEIMFGGAFGNSSDLLK